MVHHYSMLMSLSNSFVPIAHIHVQDLLSQVELPLPKQCLCIDVSELAGYMVGPGKACGLDELLSMYLQSDKKLRTSKLLTCHACSHNLDGFSP